MTNAIGAFPAAAINCRTIAAYPVRGHAHRRQRIALVRVEAGGHEHELRRELLQHRHDHAAVDKIVVSIRRAHFERHVDREPGARSSARLVSRAGARIKRKLVRRDDTGHAGRRRRSHCVPLP